VSHTTASYSRLKTGALFLFAGALALLLTDSPMLQRWDQVIYDLHAGLWSRPPPSDIRIVAIDEQSIEALGRFPWPRRTHRELIARLTAAGSRAIGLDLILSQPDKFDPAGDLALAEAIRDSGRVILPLFPETKAPFEGLVAVHPLPVFEQAAAGVGHVDGELDSDGIARSVFLKAGLGVARWPAFPLAMLQLDEVIDGALPGQRRKGTEVASNGLWVRDHRVLIPFAGPPGHFNQFSYIDVLKVRVNVAEFANKWVLIGVTAAGFGNLLPTPTTGHQPMNGVEFNANILDTLLRGNAIRPLDLGWNRVITLLLVLSSLFLSLHLATRWTLLAWLGLLLPPLLLSTFMMEFFRYWFAPASALLLIGLVYPVGMWTRLKQVVQQASTEKQKAEASLSTLSDSILVIDREGIIEYLNSAAEGLIGYSIGQIQVHSLQEILSVSDDENGGAMTAVLDGNRHITVPCKGEVTSHSGEHRPVWIRSTPLRDRWGRRLGQIVTLYEDSREQMTGKANAASSYLDALTGLPNRALLATQLNRIIARAKRAVCNVAVLIINLDRFRRVNDGLGHQVGDQLLQAVATRLKKSIRGSDLLARNSSDEFVVILEDLSSGRSVANIARQLLEQLALPFEIENREINVTVTIGISLYPQDGRTPELLLKSACAALNTQKQNVPGNFRFASDEIRQLIQQRSDLEHRLHHALERGELELYYQPQIDLKTGNIVAAEALLRCCHLNGEMIPSSHFISLAEESGLIHPIGKWVFDSSCRQLRQWQDEGMAPLRIAVNLSPIQFDAPNILIQMKQSLEKYQIDPELIELEITESSIMKNIELTTKVLREFKAMGGHIAVDDFGTGYSTFAYLKHLPADCLKIDKSFVRDITAFQNDAFITLSIISMAHGLGLKVVAEGVETAEQLTLLSKQNCDLGQGFYLSRPLPPREFAAMVRKSIFNGGIKGLHGKLADKGCS
jgi:diguanylate cyclase (GGDEF)-like protein/PAS domain S-box-containing protein